MSSFIDGLVARIKRADLSDLPTVNRSGSANQADIDSPSDAMASILATRKPDGRYLSVAGLKDPEPVNAQKPGMAMPPDPNQMQPGAPYIPPDPSAPQPAPAQPGQPQLGQPQPGQPPAQPAPPPQGVAPAPMPPVQPPPMQGQPPAPPQPQAPQPQQPSMQQQPPTQQPTKMAAMQIAKQAFYPFMGLPMGMASPMMAPMLGVPRQDEPTLQQNYERQRDVILNLAGQLDPQSGRPYKTREVDRLMNSLNSTAQRALRNMRMTSHVYKEPEKPSEKQGSFIDQLLVTLYEKKANNFNPMASPQAGLYRPHPMSLTGQPWMPYGYNQGAFNNASVLNPGFGMWPGVTQGNFSGMNSMQGVPLHMMPGMSGMYGTPGMSGMSSYAPPTQLPGAFMPYGGSGGYNTNAYGLPSLSEGDEKARDRAEQIRQQLSDIRQRQLNTQLQRANAQSPTLDREYEEAVQALRAAARKTSIANPGDLQDLEQLDPLTRKPMNFRLNSGQVNSVWSNPFGTDEYWNTSGGNYQKFVDARTRVKDLERKRELAQANIDKVMGGPAELETRKLERQLRRQEANSEKGEEFNQQMREQMFKDMRSRQNMGAGGFPFPGMQPQYPQPQYPQPHYQPQAPQQPAQPAPAQPPATTTTPPPPATIPAPEPQAKPELPKPPEPLVNAGLSNSLGKAAAVVKQANPALLRALQTMGITAGTGAVGGALYGGSTAPSDYMLEGAMRGATTGAVAGAGIGAGGLLGWHGGRGIARGLNIRHQRSLPSSPVTPLRGSHPALNPHSAGLFGTAGMGLGVTGAGLAANVAAQRGAGLPEWETGQVPLMERMDEALRRRNNAPSFQNTIQGNSIPRDINHPIPGGNYMKLSSAKHVLTNMGVLSDREKQRAERHEKATSGTLDAYSGAIGGGLGGVAGAGVGGLHAQLNKGHVPKGAIIGALTGMIPGLLTGSTIGAHNNYVRNRDSYKPSNTALERMVPSYNPLDELS